MLDWLKARIDDLFKKLSDFIDFIKGFFISIFEWMQDAYDSFINFIENFPQWIFHQICEGVVSFFNSIPVPSFFSQASSAMQSIPPEVLYFTAMFRLDFGVSVVLLALLIRFVIRRIPIIG